ncbi:ABC transporter ATP-binding protein [Pseudoclavibacter helvolus]|uniref:ABC transporter ATP-binding protein n=1 Tax=Pseudoclavibacter helvolus TaxID=255205 RepID=UPI003C73D500
MTAGLSLDASVVVGGFRAEYALDVHPGEVLAVLGPNGAGKSTLLRAIAGLAPLERGTLRLGPVLAEEAPSGVRLSARERHLGVVFQDYALFGHLSALDNVAFGLRARGSARAEARTAASAWLERLGVGELADRRPGQLSGGQAQKIALARALATSPQVLLLDEPLAALDVESRSAVRSELRRVLASFNGAALVVTHDATDAAALADRIAVVERGRITQLGTPEALADGPATAYVAALVGRTGFEVQWRGAGVAVHAALGAIEGRLAGPAGADPVGAGPAGADAGPTAPTAPAEPGERMFASIRCDRVQLLLPEERDAGLRAADARQSASNPRLQSNVWAAKVERLERGLGSMTATLLIGDQRQPSRLTARLPFDTGARSPGGLHEGQSVIAHLPPAHVAFAATR